MKTILKSDSALLAIGNNPSWTTDLDYGRVLSLVQGSSYSINIEREQTKSLGDRNLFVDSVIKAPEVEVQIEYNLSPFLNNEFLFGFKKSSQNMTQYSQALEDLADRNNSLYLLIEEKDGEAVDRTKRTPSSNLSGFSAIACGNCYLTKYSASWSVGSIPKASASFMSSNMEFNKITGARMPIPAINSLSGNQDGRGFLAVDQLYQTLPSGFIFLNKEARTEFNASTAVASSSNFTLENLSCGGINIANSQQSILQSFDLSIDIDRTALYGLGSNYPYGRKMNLPANSTVSISAMASGISTGTFEKLMKEDNSHILEIAFSDEKKYATGFFRIENAKLTSLSFSLGVNEILSFNASFLAHITDQFGFSTKRVNRFI